MTEIVTNNALDPRSTRASAMARLQPWFTEARALLSLGLPLIATQLAHMAMPTTDILMLGVLGQEALAAAALATTAYVFLWLIGLGPASAVAPVIAQIVGANPSDRARVRVALRMGFWSVLILCVPIGIGLFFAEEALLALGQAPELARLAGPYVQVLSLGLPFSFGFNVLRNFSTALGRPRPPLAIMCAGVLLNIVLDYALIFGRFGMPEMGMIGAAFSTALVTAFCFFTLAGFVTFAPSFRSYRIWRRFHRPDWKRLAEILRLGFSMGLTMIFEVALFAGSTLLMGQFGTSVVAAHQIAMNVPSITFMVPLGIAMAATVRVGQAAGAGDAEGVRRAGITALTIGAGFMLIAGLVLASFPRAITGLYLDLASTANAEAIATTVSFLYVAAAFQIFDGIQVIAAFALRGLKDVRMPLIIAGLSYWAAGFPLTLLFGFVLGWEGVGVWVGLASSLAIAAALLTMRFLYLSATTIR